MKRQLLYSTLAVALTFFFISCGDTEEKTPMKKVTRKIEVTGSAEMEVEPDEIYMVFSLREYMEGNKKVSLDIIKSDFLGYCNKAGIDKKNVTIASYSGNERYNYNWYYRRKNEPEFKGSISYQVKVASTAQLDELLSKVDEDALSNFYIGKTSHSAIEKHRKKVKMDAVIASKNKAKYLAESVGEKVGETLLIEEIESYDGFQANFIRGRGNYSNVSEWVGDSDNATTGFQKIKLRYKIKASYRLK